MVAARMTARRSGCLASMAIYCSRPIQSGRYSRMPSGSNVDAVGAQPGDEVDAAGGAGEAREGIGAESRVEHVVLRAVVPEWQPDAFDGGGFGPLADGQPAVDLAWFRGRCSPCIRRPGRRGRWSRGRRRAF